MIPQMEPIFGPEEAQAVAKYLSTNPWLTEYKRTRELEAMICEYVDSKHCIMMPNCTLAIYASLKVLGIGPGDQVLVPDFTMIATANAVRMAGAWPVFVDIERNSLCMNIWQAERAVTAQTGALIYVSLNGRSGDMEAITDFCKRHNLWLIEDAAQSLGSSHKGQHLGTFGDVGCFSLSCQKIITTGNGGFCVTNSDEIAHKLRLFKDFGRRSGGGDNYESFGINLKFTDLQAVIGIEQMKRLPDRAWRKREMYANYLGGLLGTTGIEFTPTNLEDTPPWFIDVLVEIRPELMEHLGAKGISTRAMYPALHKTPVYRSTHGNTRMPVSEDIAGRGLWLPSSVNLSNRDIERICTHIRDFYES